jgi:hypothetical protein
MPDRDNHFPQTAIPYTVLWQKVDVLLLENWQLCSPTITSSIASSPGDQLVRTDAPAGDYTEDLL